MCPLSGQADTWTERGVCQQTAGSQQFKVCITSIQSADKQSAEIHWKSFVNAFTFLQDNMTLNTYSELINVVPFCGHPGVGSEAGKAKVFADTALVVLLLENILFVQTYNAFLLWIEKDIISWESWKSYHHQN